MYVYKRNSFFPCVWAETIESQLMRSSRIVPTPFAFSMFIHLVHTRTPGTQHLIFLKKFGNVVSVCPSKASWRFKSIFYRQNQMNDTCQVFHNTPDVTTLDVIKCLKGKNNLKNTITSYKILCKYVASNRHFSQIILIIYFFGFFWFWSSKV